MRKRVSLGLVISVALLVSLVAGVVFADNSWSKSHWDISTDESIADPLDFVDNTGPVWTASVAEASIDWNASVIQNEIITGSNPNCDPVLGRVEVCDDLYGANGWLGIAQVWVYRGKDGHIAQSLVKLNNTYFDTPQYDSQAWRDFVTCQELGHTLGLGHQDEIFDNANLGTCMDYTDDPDGTIYGQLSNLHPDQHDLDVLTEKYGHLNGIKKDPGGKKGGGGDGGGPDCEAKPNHPKCQAGGPGNSNGNFGKAIGHDGKGRANLFERELGNGNKLITHVYWAN